MRTNLKASGPRTYESAPAISLSHEQQLRRAVLSCLLWEDQFYESGVDIAKRIGQLCLSVDATFIKNLAIEARTEHNLRHAPLLLLCGLAAKRTKSGAVAEAVQLCVQRADEMTELLAIYWKLNGKNSPLPAQFKKGLMRAISHFNSYELAKYNQLGKKVKLRDVINICHPRPLDTEQSATFKAILENNLTPPDTWEVALTRGADKKETFERLLREKKLGYLALLRNLRNMEEAGVDRDLIKEALANTKNARRVLPFRFISALRAAPSLARSLDAALYARLADMPRLRGNTTFLVDVSGSMNDRLSSSSQVTRMVAAAGLVAIANCEAKRILTFSEHVVEVPDFSGLSIIKHISDSQPHGGTYLGRAVLAAESKPSDRLIIITDEQSHDEVTISHPNAYIINLGSYQNGVGFGSYTRINGFSEATIKFIMELEASRG